jgi:selenocysteine-specific elongation factor
MSTTRRLVVGTAGHIDHGKSALVRALTGIDPDRLPEEQARGMTIDLGFAYTQIDDCQVAFVDVPGHERFIRNMVAGVTGIDAALLVVAADDSVMPQTREHAEVLSLLGIEHCVLVLTKMDLVDEGWADAVEEEAVQLLGGLGIAPFGVVRTSVQTGRGLEDLRATLARLARERGQRPEPYSWFCLPIDRAFVIAGRGVVVTGTVSHGTVARDDELELWPAGARVRVRDLQTHHESCEVAAGRRRLALNLAGLSREQVGRGCTLATPGYLEPARCLEVWLASLRMPGKTPRQRMRLRLHIATSELLAELRLAEKPQASVVRGVFGQLVVAQPVVATWGQRFILRDEPATRTLGGGKVLRPVSRLWSSKRPPHVAGLQMLLQGSPAERLEEVIRAAQWQPLSDAQLAVRSGLTDAHDAACQARRLCDQRRVHLLEAGSARLYVHRDWLRLLDEDLDRRLRAYLEQNPRTPGLPRAQAVTWMPAACPERLRPALAQWWLEKGAVCLHGDYVVPAGSVPDIGPADQALLDAILQEFEAAAFQPPALRDLKCANSRNERRIRELVELATARRKLVRIGPDLWLHESRWRELVQRVLEAMRQRGPLTVADIRTLLNSSRKYVVPIVEQLDAAGITRREGDLRHPGPKADQVLQAPPGG